MKRTGPTGFHRTTTVLALAGAFVLAPLHAEEPVLGQIFVVGARASSAPRFPGDCGGPIVYASRPNAEGQVTDDRVTLNICVDNDDVGTPHSRNVSICASVAGMPQIDTTNFWTARGTTTRIQNPITFPAGRSVLTLELGSRRILERLQAQVDAQPTDSLTIEFQAFVDDPNGIDVDPCILEGDPLQNARSCPTSIQIRNLVYQPDEGLADSFTSVPFGGIGVRFRAIDGPKVPYRITAFEVVVGGPGQDGLDAVVLYREDRCRPGVPQVAEFDGLASVGGRDGKGDGRGCGPGPTTLVLPLDSPVSIDPASPEFDFCGDLFLVAYFTGSGACQVATNTTSPPRGESFRIVDDTFGPIVTYSQTENFLLRLVVEEEP